MSLQQLVTTALKKSPLARELTGQITAQLDAKRAAAHRALEATRAQGERETREALDAEAEAQHALEDAVRAQQAATTRLAEAWQRRSQAALIAYGRETQLTRELEALAAPEIGRFVAWVDAVATAIMAAPLATPSDPTRRHAWDVGASTGSDAWERERSSRVGILDRLRSAREDVEAMKLSGAPQAETAKALGSLVRKLRDAVREIRELRASKLMEGDPLAEPEPAA